MGKVMLEVNNLKTKYVTEGFSLLNLPVSYTYLTLPTTSRV